MSCPTLCQVGSNTWLRHKWSGAGKCERCGAQLPPIGRTLLLSQSDVADLLATHPRVIGRLRAGEEDKLAVHVIGDKWEVEKLA